MYGYDNVSILRTKSSGLYRHREDLGLHKVGYKERNLHIWSPSLPSMPRRVPSGHGAVFGLRVLHSPSFRPMANKPDARGPLTPGLPHPPPHGPLVAQPTYFFLLYISTYPENIQEHHKTLFPPPQPSVPRRSDLGSFSGAPPEGESTTEGLYIISKASSMSCE